jgi:hypothetical protein
MHDHGAMPKSTARRRAARKRKEQVRGRHGGGEQPHPEDVSRGYLLRQLASAGAATASEYERERVAVGLAAADPAMDEDGVVADLLLGALQRLWEHGWQPADAVHVVQRQGTQRLARLAVAVIAEEARVARAPSRAPQEWLDQLTAIGALSGRDRAVLAGWARGERLDAVDAWRDVLVLLGRLTRLPALQELGAPPSRWGQQPPRRPTGPSSADGRVLRRIRALLTKAESTDFPDEAEALSAKAQELMTRHAVDAAFLAVTDHPSLPGEVVARRVHVSNPYPDAKVHLLSAVAAVNTVRVVWLEELGIVTTVGLPVDVDAVELLFTSLLVQATRALTAAGRAGTARTRSPAFRRSFLLSYAMRIGERLDEARQRVTDEAEQSHGAALLPVLRARGQAVDDVFAELFPQTSAVTSRVTDEHGWRAGRRAADAADLGSGRGQVQG